MTPAQSHRVSVAWSRGAAVTSCSVQLTPKQVGHVEEALRWLTKLGEVAAFGIEPESAAGLFADLLAVFEGKVGDLTLQAVLGSGAPPAEPSPSYLMPVGLFDFAVGERPRAYARFLGLDLDCELYASPDEEIGFYLAGQDWPWLLTAFPAAGLGTLSDKGPQQPPEARRSAGGRPEQEPEE